MSKSWYNSKRWKQKRAELLITNPLCVMCNAQGKVTPATVADHIVPHRFDRHMFWQGELQALCHEHHASSKQREEANGYSSAIDKDGYPIDPRHPFNG